MRHKAEKLFAKICSARNGCVNLIMETFEDVAVNFAWEMLIGYGCSSSVTTGRSRNQGIEQLKLSFRDYALSRPFRPDYQYPPYKTQVEIVRESMEKYYHRRYYKCSYCEHSFQNVGKKNCPKCNSTNLYHITQAGYNKERAKRCNYRYWPGLCTCNEHPTVKDVKDWNDGDPDKGLPVGYISFEDMEFLWECMPKWIKQETPLLADQKIRKKVERILHRNE